MSTEYRGPEFQKRATIPDMNRVLRSPIRTKNEYEVQQDTESREDRTLSRRWYYLGVGLLLLGILFRQPPWDSIASLYAGALLRTHYSPQVMPLALVASFVLDYLSAPRVALNLRQVKTPSRLFLDAHSGQANFTGKVITHHIHQSTSLQGGLYVLLSVFYLHVVEH